MTSLKSLKLGGFRNALRKLLHKTPPPAADGSGSSSPAGGQHLQGEGEDVFPDIATNGHGGSNRDGKDSSRLLGGALSLEHDTETITITTTKTSINSGKGNAGGQHKHLNHLNHLNNNHGDGDGQNDDWSQALNGDFSQIVKSHADDDETTILRNTIINNSNPNFASRTDGQDTITTTADNALTTSNHHLTENITPDSTMAPSSQPLTEQTRPTQKAPPGPQLQTWISQQKSENKENVPPEELSGSLAVLRIDDDTLNKGDTIKAATVPVKTQDDETRVEEQQPEIDYSWLNDPVIAAERAQHLRFIGEALDMARLALRINETPVGCVLVHNGKIIAKGMNATNVTRNGTRHAEYMALAALFSYSNPDGPRVKRLKPKELTDREDVERAARAVAIEEEKAARAAAGEEEPVPDPEMSDAISETLSMDQSPHEGNDDGKKGHLHPYGQKMIDLERVDRCIVSESTLYVTVEPCIMCASLLRQLKVKKVYFGAVNDKFGGTGGVFSLHANSLPVREDGQTASAHPIATPIQLPDGTGGSLGVSFPPGGGDGGNVEPGYEIEGGWGRDDAVALLRRFYVQENGRAPVPRKKEGRAARLAAMMEGDVDGETVTPSEGAETNGAATDDVRNGSSESSYHEFPIPTEVNGVEGHGV